MPKRVSLKGRGADIFFGDLSPAAAAEEPPVADSVETPPSPQPFVEAQPRKLRQPPRASQQSSNAPPRARVHARTQSSTAAETSARVRTAMSAALTRKLAQKQRLASYTFRFRPEELDELERALQDLTTTSELRPSKNDLVRLSLLWLLADYREQGEASVLVQVLARM